MNTNIYTVPSLASLLNLSERKVRDLLNSGEINGYKKCGRWFVLHEDLTNWITSQPL